MALQTSGAISLNDIHVEAGGSSGTQASMNDSDIRGLISKSSGAQMSFNEWYGASSFTPPALGTHRISNTVNSIHSQYGTVMWHPSQAYISNWTNYGAYQYGAIDYMYLSASYGTHTGGSTTTNINYISMYLTFYSMSTPLGHPNYYNQSRTLFSEIDTTSSRMAITDNSNNLLWVADFSGNEISGLPSSIGTGSFYFGQGECTPDSYQWSAPTKPLVLNINQTYKIWFASS